MRKLIVAVVLLLMASLSGCSKTDSSSTPNAGVTAGAGPRNRQGGLYLRLPDGRQLPHSVLLLRGQEHPEYKGDWNQIHNTARVATPADTALQTPNSDTPYSFLGADLRAEPLVLTVPPIDDDRFYSLQFIDGYTYNFDYVGTRTTGNAGGNYLLAGPGWTGDKPAGIDKVIRSETDLDFVPTAPNCSARTTSTTSPRSRPIPGSAAVDLSQPVRPTVGATGRLDHSAYR